MKDLESPSSIVLAPKAAMGGWPCHEGRNSMSERAYTELETLLMKADQHSIIAKLAVDPDVRKTNERLAAEYFDRAEKLVAAEAEPLKQEVDRRDPPK